MKYRTILITSAFAALTALTGCASNPNNQQLGIGAGAVLGGVAGNAIFGGTAGTVGGAAAGALIGNEVGKRSDERRYNNGNNYNNGNRYNNGNGYYRR